MTKKQKIRNKKKKIVVIAAFIVLLLIISAISTVTVINYVDNIELGNSESDILYYNENEKQENNNVLIVGIDENKDEEEPEETKEDNQAKTTNNSDNKTNTATNKNTKKVVDAPYYIKVNYKANVVTVYKKDNSGKYTKAVKAMVCSCGTATPTSGVYTISDKYTWRLLQGDVYGQYACRITGHILFHSVPYTKKDKASLEWWEYDKLGTTASLGCVRLAVKDVKWIYDNCIAGTQVEFYGDTNPGPLGKPTAQKISGNTEVRNWDPTDPDKANPWSAYLKKKEEAAAAAKAAEEAKKAEEKKIQETSTKPVEDKTNTTTKPVEDKTNTTTKPVEDKTNTTNKTQGTNTTPVENKTTETNKTTNTGNTNTNTNTNTNKDENKNATANSTKNTNTTDNSKNTTKKDVNQM